MRVAVCNAFWTTAGGGETYALAIARALARHHDVDLVGPVDVDWAEVGERLQFDLDDFSTRAADFESRAAVTAVSRDYDLFVNTTFGTDVPSAATRSLLVVHFPHRFDSDLGPASRVALRLFLRSRLRASTPDVQWGDGFHGVEGRGPVFRWTDGDAHLDIWAPPGRTVPVEIGFGAANPVPTEVEIRYEGTRVAGAEVGGDGAAPVSVAFKVTGRPDGSPVPVQIVSDTFVPADAWGSHDQRTLGVQVRKVRVGAGARSRIFEVAPFLERAQLLRWLDTYDALAANSAYTSRWIRRWWGRDARVLHPAVEPIERLAKQPTILSVGRFFAASRGHSKKQLEMIVAFRRLVETGMHGWELHLVGGCQPEDSGYLDAARAMAFGLPITFHVDAAGHELRKLYGQASIYWHATGLHEDEAAVPEQLEHFGIAVVEAMSAGAVPVVYGAGGPADVVGDGVEGLHFRSLDQLVARTRQLIDDESLRTMLADRAHASAAARFSPDSLAVTLDGIVAELG